MHRSPAGPTAPPPQTPGQLSVWLSSNVVPPKENVTVYVEGAWPESGQDSVAIYVCRDRPSDNSKFFAVKRCRPPRGARPGEPCRRQVQFYAPSGQGLFEFRVFDGVFEDGEEPPKLTGTSPRLRVDVQGRAACEEIDNITKKLAECKMGPVAVPDAIDARRAADSVINLRTLVHYLREPSPEIGAKLGVALEHVMRIAAALSGSYLRAVKAKAAVAEAEAVAAAVAAAAGDGVPEEEGGGDSGAAVTAAAAGAKAGAGAPIGDGDEGAISALAALSLGGEGGAEGDAPAPAPADKTQDLAKCIHWLPRERAVVHAVAKSCFDVVLHHPSLHTCLSEAVLHRVSVVSAVYCPLTDTLLVLSTHDAHKSDLPEWASGPMASRVLMCFIATIVNAYEAGAVDTALADILAGLSVGELSTLERGRSAYATTVPEHIIMPEDVVPPSRVEPPTVMNISSVVAHIAGRLMPAPDFDAKRQEVLRRVAGGLNEGLLEYAAGVCRPTWYVFGSSANGFGREDSDIDVCILWTDHSNTPVSPPFTPSDLVLRVAELLPSLGMENISARETARIPIVSFHDPVSGLDVDFCGVSNSLAIRNTALLRTYAKVDDRVVPLAMFIKNWASVRKVNDPPKYTPSSYAYVLMVISALQRRPVPVLPCLQLIGPDWDGSAFDAPTSSPPPVTVQSLTGKPLDTYFYQPVGERGEAALVSLRSCAARNVEPLGALMLEFFWAFSIFFDSRREVVTAKSTRRVFKDEKGCEGPWGTKPLISVEDPFETTYDVVHVLRAVTNRVVKLEMARAYLMLIRIARDSGQDLNRCHHQIVHNLLRENVVAAPSEADPAPDA